MDVLGAGAVTVLKCSRNSNRHASLLFMDPTPSSYIFIGPMSSRQLMWVFLFPVLISGFNSFYASLIYNQAIKRAQLGDQSRLVQAALTTLSFGNSPA